VRKKKSLKDEIAVNLAIAYAMTCIGIVFLRNIAAALILVHCRSLDNSQTSRQDSNPNAAENNK
jgi:hypothetical protein